MITYSYLVLLAGLIFMFIGIRFRWASVVSLICCILILANDIFSLALSQQSSSPTETSRGSISIVSVLILVIVMIVDICLLCRRKKTKAAKQDRLTPPAAASDSAPAQGTNASGQGTPQRTTGRLTERLDLYDSIIYKGDWNGFRRRATQDELTALAIGSRYRLTGSAFYLKSILSVVGTIASIVLGICFMESFLQLAILIIVVGYSFFNLLASKLLGYSDTFRSCKAKMDKEHRDIIKMLFPEHILLFALRELVLICLNIFTLPYQFLLLIIETLIPPARNWAIKHGGSAGAVITLPKGYDIGDLGALGDYYASATFCAAFEEHLQKVERERLEKFSAYEYTDKYGMKQIAYSDDGKAFYTGTDKLKEVGTSKDGGKTIDLKQ